MLTLVLLLAVLRAAALDLSAANRRPAVAGLPDWSQVGYERGQKPLPDDSQVGTTLSAAELASKYGVVPDDGKDDTAGLAQAIAGAPCSFCAAALADTAQT